MPSYIAHLAALFQRTHPTAVSVNCKSARGTRRRYACVYAGAVICFGGLIFAGIRMMNERFQFVAPLKDLGVANRNLGTIQRIEGGCMTVQMDRKDKRYITFDTEGPRGLMNTRLAYVAISRASEHARIYTNDATNLGRSLAYEISKTEAIDPTSPSVQNRIEIAAPEMQPEMNFYVSVSVPDIAIEGFGR